MTNFKHKTKTKFLILLLLICSCKTKKDILGSYRTDKNNVIDIELIIKPDNNFVLTYRGSMTSDSIFGNYKLNNNKGYFISKTKDLNISKTKISKTKNENPNETTLFFTQSEIGFDVHFQSSKLVINDTLVKDIFIDFEKESTIIDCNDKIVYRTQNFTEEIKSLDCDFDYKIKTYLRAERKIFPDTLIIDFKKIKKINILKNSLKKKRKHNNV